MSHDLDRENDFDLELFEVKNAIISNYLENPAVNSHTTRVCCRPCQGQSFATRSRSYDSRSLTWNGSKSTAFGLNFPNRRVLYFTRLLYQQTSSTGLHLGCDSSSE